MDTTPPMAQGMQVPQMKVVCPHCGAALLVEASQAGTAVTCAKCGGKFQAPLPVANAPGLTATPAVRPEVKAFADKKLAAGLCGILLGGLGVHKFILGFNGAGTIMLVVYLVGAFLGACLIVPILATMAMGVIGLVEGIMYLTKSDEEFYQLYAVQKKEWF